MGLNHPYRGACVDESCEYHGYCHCGCGEVATISRQNDAPRQYVIRQPRRYRPGHSPRSRSNMGYRGAEVQALVHRKRHDHYIPMERIRPLVLWVIKRYGVDRTAQLMGMSRSTISNLAWAKHQKRVTPKTALRVSRCIVELRQANRMLAPVETSHINLRDDEKIPAAPLREALERYIQSEGVAVVNIQQHYSDRFGAELRTGIRHYRLVRDHDLVSLTVADRWCALLGIPLDYVYAEEAS